MRVPHGKKEVRKAIRQVEALGCTVEETPSGHKWGRLTAPNGQFTSIWSTPRSADNEAKRLIRFALRHQK